MTRLEKDLYDGVFSGELVQPDGFNGIRYVTSYAACDKWYNDSSHNLLKYGWPPERFKNNIKRSLQWFNSCMLLMLIADFNSAASS